MFLQVWIVITGNDYAPVITNDTTFTVIIDETFLSSSNFIITKVVASDEDSGKNAELSYSLLETRVGLERTETVLIVAANDGGDPSLSANATIIVNFFIPCLVQQYVVESLTGIVSGFFLCSINIQPLQQQVIAGAGFSFTCTVIGNVPGLTVSLLHNNTLTVDEMMLSSQDSSVTFERFNSTFVDAGRYQCRINSSIGTFLSNISTLSIATLGKSSLFMYS